MKKTARPGTKPPTHFKQISVATVKKIAVTPKAPAPVKASRRLERPI